MVLLADANILLEILLPSRLRAKQVGDLLVKNQVAISTLTVHLVYYFALKDGKTVEQVSNFISRYQIFDLLAVDYNQALKLIKNGDIEDALQLAVAIRSGCEAVITLDSKFAKTYKESIRFIVPS